ncbi:MAG: hypothetical protein R3320_03550 [Nitriliruptorales bacterium]|nr:hypothetical protein [Nitriliruptorales bacterium]
MMPMLVDDSNEGRTMTRIRATCPRCGEIDLRPKDIELEVVRSEVGEIADGSRYSFACPDCADTVIKPADERIASLLRSGGVSVTERPADPRPAHPEDPPGGPAFTRDDLLDLHLLLAEPGWFDEVMSLTSDAGR